MDLLYTIRDNHFNEIEFQSILLLKNKYLYAEIGSAWSMILLNILCNALEEGKYTS